MVGRINRFAFSFFFFAQRVGCVSSGGWDKEKKRKKKQEGKKKKTAGRELKSARKSVVVASLARSLVGRFSHLLFFLRAPESRAPGALSSTQRLPRKFREGARRFSEGRGSCRERKAPSATRVFAPMAVSGESKDKKPSASALFRRPFSLPRQDPSKTAQVLHCGRHSSNRCTCGRERERRTGGKRGEPAMSFVCFVSSLPCFFSPCLLRTKKEGRKK